MGKPFKKSQIQGMTLQGEQKNSRREGIIWKIDQKKSKMEKTK